MTTEADKHLSFFIILAEVPQILAKIQTCLEASQPRSSLRLRSGTSQSCAICHKQGYPYMPVPKAHRLSRATFHSSLSIECAPANDHQGIARQRLVTGLVGASLPCRLAGAADARADSHVCNGSQSRQQMQES